MRILLSVFFIASIGFCWGQQPLTGIKEGNWIILNGSKQKQLPEHYYDVGNFDQHGFAYFASNGKYGIINGDGKEVLEPQFIRLKSFGWGMFGGITEEENMLINLNGSTKIDTCKRWTSLNDFWMFYFVDGEKKLLNFPSGLTIGMDSTFSVTRRSLGYVFVDSLGTETLYNPHGEKVDLEGGFAVMTEHFIRLKSSKKHTLILANNQSFELPLETNDFKFDGNYFQYSTPNRTVRTDVFGEVLMDVPYGRIIDAGFDRFIFGDKGLFGIMDGMGEVIVPATYLFINATRNGYFITTRKGTGILSKTGVEIVPPIYKSIQKQGDLYIVESNLGLFGVYSSRFQKSLVEPTFKKVTISEDRIRGWFNETLQILYFNEKHEIEKKLTLNNTVSRFRLASEGTAGFDPRLLTIGWFFEEQPMFDEEGFNVGTSLKWGVKDAADSVLLKPRLSTPFYIPSANFSLIPMGKKEVEFMGNTMKDKRIFNAIDVTNGRVIPGQFLDVDTTDALTREYLRYSSINGFGYITQDNKVHPVLHFDRENDTYLRFTTSETGNYKVIETENREAVRLSRFKLNNPDKPEYRNWNYRGMDYTHVLLEDAEWNFLSPQGIPLFDESFEYADRFFKHTAIVKSNGRWGVVNTDSLFISTEYNSIERMKAFHDTVFLVRKPLKGMRFLNSNSNELNLGIQKVVKSMGQYSIVETNQGEIVLDKQNHVISKEGNRFRALNDRYFMTWIDRESRIYDADGNFLAAVDAKARDVFFDQLILYRDGASSFGIVDASGDTLLPPDYKSITVWGDFLLAEGRDTRVLNSVGEQLFMFETEEVLIDSVTNLLSVNDGGKITILNKEGDKRAKFKNMDPDAFINGVLFQFGRNGYGKHIDEEREFAVQDGIKSVVSAEASGFILETDIGYQILDKNWERYPDVGKRTFEKCRYLGEGVVYFKKPLNFIFSAKYGLHRQVDRPVKEFDSELGLMYDNGGRKYLYVTPEGENVFEQEFEDAKPFKDGYAAVKMTKGWAIIDANGRAKSLDSYGEIEVHGNNIFETENASLYGLIDHHGKVLIETEYERLEILHGDIIQAVKSGEIFYFKSDGTPIPY